MMSVLQKIFNQVVKHLDKQGVQCITANNQCQYRLEKGKKVLRCAAGCLIPKRDYLKMQDIESSSVYIMSNAEHANTVTKYFHKKYKNNERAVRLIRELQIVHDSFFYTRHDKFRSIAQDFGLTYTPVSV